MQLNETLPLNFGIEELVREFAALAGTPVHVLIARIINNRWQEMEEVIGAAEEHPEGSERHTAIMHLIAEYGGGDYIYAELKRIDPDYLTPEESMNAMLDEPEMRPQTDEMFASLDADVKATSQ